MNKKALLYFTILIWAAVLLQLGVTIGLKDDRQLIEAFEVTHSVPVKSTIQVTGTYDNYLISRLEKERCLLFLGEGLGIQDKYNLEETGQNLSGLTYTKHGLYGDTIIRLLPKEKEKEKQRIVTTITLNQNTESIMKMKEQLTALYKKLNMKPQILIDMNGTFPGKLSKEQQEDVKEDIYRRLEAKECKNISLDNCTSSYGFTQRLDEYQMLNGEKVNIQITFGYKEKDKTTTMHLAVPFLNEDF